MKMKNILILLILLISVNAFSQKSIISINKIGQAKDGTLHYVSREIIRFNQLNNVELTAIVEEKLLSKEAVLDSLGVDTGAIKYVLVENKGQTATKFPNSTVDYLFSSLGENINFNESFIGHFNSLQQKALLIYTKQINRYGTTDWTLKID